MAGRRMGALRRKGLLDVRTMTVSLALLALGVLAVGGYVAVRSADEPAPDSPPADASPEQGGGGDLDRFGVRQLYPTAPDAVTWTADWSGERSFVGVDPVDPWFDTDHGDASYEATDGTLAITGEVPRMFVRDPDKERQWRDVEITMYFKRVADDEVDYAGMVSIARTNHGITGDETEDLCDSRGLGARMRYDGDIDFDKETAHPHTEAVSQKTYWPEGMPYDVWIGYKHIVFDLPDGSVRQELWIDESGGEDGGDWTLVNEVVDDGNLAGHLSCADGVDPELQLTNDPDRPGSESGKPNLSVYFRSDGVGENGLVYKWGSVREITPAP